MAHGVTLVKRFTYRGDASEEWSNSYFFKGGTTPADDDAWGTLVDALVTQEKTVYTSGVQVVRAYGYDSDADNAHAVFVRDYTVSPLSVVPGTLTASASNPLYPGDVAAWVRWGTERFARGKRVYLRKYFHGIQIASSLNQDSISAAQVTALTALGAKLRDGSFLGGRTLTARGHSDTLVNHGVSPYATTRTLKRRPKRNPS